MPAVSEQQTQIRPSGTSAVNAFSARKPQQVTISKIVVANTTGSSAAYSIFHDADGSTFDQGTALFYGVPLDGNATEIIDLSGSDSDGVTIAANGQLGVQTSVGNALTFTAYGYQGVRK